MVSSRNLCFVCTYNMYYFNQFYSMYYALHTVLRNMTMSNMTFIYQTDFMFLEFGVLCVQLRRSTNEKYTLNM